MPAHLIARRDDIGRWTLERDGTPLVATPGVPEDELVERIEELVVIGWLDETDRVAVVDARECVASRRIHEFIRFDERGAFERDLAAVRAERYASEEHYV
jgi:hypothetical protein